MSYRRHHLANSTPWLPVPRREGGEEGPARDRRAAPEPGRLAFPPQGQGLGQAPSEEPCGAELCRAPGHGSCAAPPHWHWCWRGDTHRSPREMTDSLSRHCPQQRPEANSGAN